MRERLLAIQVREHLSDEGMATRLQCSRSLWSMVRRGKMPLSHEMAIRATGAFPELTLDLLEMASASVSTVPARSQPEKEAA